MPRLSLSSVFNYADVAFRSGEKDGNRLKNIPQTHLSNRLGAYLTNDLQLTFGHNYIGEVFLDDENEVTLPSYQTVDARLAMGFRHFRIHLGVFNLLDEKYSSGYVLFDPMSQQDVSYFFPAQGRSLQAGIDFSLWKKFGQKGSLIAGGGRRIGP